MWGLGRLRIRGFRIAGLVLVTLNPKPYCLSIRGGGGCKVQGWEAPFRQNVVDGTHPKP